MPTEAKLYTNEMLNRVAQGEFDDDMRTANLRAAGVSPHDALHYAVGSKYLAADAGHPDSLYQRFSRDELDDMALPINITTRTPPDVVAGIDAKRNEIYPEVGGARSTSDIAARLNEGYPGAPGQDYVQALQDQLDMVTFALPEGYEGSERHVREMLLSRRMGQPLTEEVKLANIKAQLESRLANFQDSRQRYFERSLPETYGGFLRTLDVSLPTVYAHVLPKTRGSDFYSMGEALKDRYDQVNAQDTPHTTAAPIEDLLKLYGASE